MDVNLSVAERMLFSMKKPKMNIKNKSKPGRPTTILTRHNDTIQTQIRKKTIASKRDNLCFQKRFKCYQLVKLNFNFSLTN